jgi:hypothetical protein
MKKLFIPLLILIMVSFNSCAQLNWGNVKKEAEKVYNQNKPLTNDEIIKGLKEALTIGSKNSSTLASKVDAYYKNPKLFIPFPPEAAKIEKTLRDFGQGKLVDDFIKTLNRAAEEAAKESAPIFVDAVKKMTINDGLKILNGADNAATSYLKTNTNTQLNAKFKPVIEKALSKVNATKYWKDIITYYNKIPTVQKMNPDLPAYATDKAIDGLFVLVANEELKIRKDPAARVTEILRKVFGQKK